ncbi:MAG: YcxB family protein [Spirochaetes bacterium]|nr:YcxB family protein [Spirochaetota bacterium]
MKISVKLDISDLDDYRKQAFGKGKSRTTVIGGMALITVFLHALFLADKNYTHASWLVIVTVWDTFLAMGILSMLHAINTSKRDFKTNKINEGVQNFEFNKNGIAFFSTHSIAKYAWNDLFKVVESKASFFVFITSERMLILPKRCFPGQKPIRQLREIFRTHFNIDRREILDEEA